MDKASDPGSAAMAGGEGAGGSDELSGTPSLRAPGSSGSVSRGLTELAPSNPVFGGTPGPPTFDVMQSFPA